MPSVSAPSLGSTATPAPVAASVPVSIFEPGPVEPPKEADASFREALQALENRDQDGLAQIVAKAPEITGQLFETLVGEARSSPGGPQIHAFFALRQALGALQGKPELLATARPSLEALVPDLMHTMESLGPGRFDESEQNLAALYLYTMIVRQFPGWQDDAFVAHGLGAMMNSTKLIEQDPQGGWTHAGSPVLKDLWSRRPDLVGQSLDLLTTTCAPFSEKDRRWDWIVDAVRDHDWKPSSSQLQWLATPIYEMASRGAELVYPSEVTTWDRQQLLPVLFEHLGDEIAATQVPDGTGGLCPPLGDALYPRLLEGIKQEPSKFLQYVFVDRLYCLRGRHGLAADYLPFIFRDPARVDEFLGSIESAGAGDLTKLDLDRTCAVVSLASLPLSSQQSDRLRSALPVRDTFLAWTDWVAEPADRRQDFSPVAAIVADRFRDEVIPQLVAQVRDAGGPAEARLEACRALEILEPTYRVATQADSGTLSAARIQRMTRVAEDASSTPVAPATRESAVLGVSPEEFYSALDEAKSATTPGLEDRYPPWIALKAHGYARRLVESGVDPEKAMGHVLEFLSLGLEVNTYGVVAQLVERGASPEEALSHVLMCQSLGRDPLDVPVAREASATGAPPPRIEQTPEGVTIGGLFVPRVHRDSPPGA